VPQQTAFPLLSVIVIIVLLNEEWIWAIPSATLFLVFFDFAVLCSHWFFRSFSGPSICFSSLTSCR
jgi:hypothetical protein